MTEQDLEGIERMVASKARYSDLIETGELLGVVTRLVGEVRRLLAENVGLRAEADHVYERLDGSMSVFFDE